jgi:hypothetical protein
VGQVNVRKRAPGVNRQKNILKNIRAADAKEVGVGNPAEETYCYPNGDNLHKTAILVNNHNFTIFLP